MKESALLDVVHDNPESTILIHYLDSDRVVRIDVGKHVSFDVKEGEGLSGVDISEHEKERRKRREDLKLKLRNAGVESIHEVYAISRINEEDESQLEVKDVRKNRS